MRVPQQMSFYFLGTAMQLVLDVYFQGCYNVSFKYCTLIIFFFQIISSGYAKAPLMEDIKLASIVPAGRP